jgi:hypothetical protein
MDLHAISLGKVLHTSRVPADLCQPGPTDGLDSVGWSTGGIRLMSALRSQRIVRQYAGPGVTVTDSTLVGWALH